MTAKVEPSKPSKEALEAAQVVAHTWQHGCPTRSFLDTIALAFDAFAAEAVARERESAAMGCCPDAPHDGPLRRPEHFYFGPRDGRHCWNRDEVGFCGKPESAHQARPMGEPCADCLIYGCPDRAHCACHGEPLAARREPKP